MKLSYTGSLPRHAAAVVVLAALAGCVSAPVEQVRPVWPPPPEQARIEFLRSLASDQDLKNDTTFSDDLSEFLSGKKPPANHLAEPMGIAVSDDGNRIYVADYGQLAIFVFDFTTGKVTRIGDKDPLNRPMGVALDDNENLYVVEQQSRDVKVYGRDGRVLRIITDSSLERPEGIAIDRARGLVYVVDTAHSKSTVHDVKVFDLGGKLLRRLGSGKGSKPGEFLFATYVTLGADGTVYVTDTLNSRVQAFDADGKYLRSFGARGSAWGMFDKPKGVALDSFGNLYVVDSGWCNVQIFNAKGEVLLFFGGNGRNPGLLWGPTAIAIDKNNRIFVADNLNHRVEMYRLVNTAAADSFIAPPAEDKSGAAAAAPTAKK